MSSAGWCVLVGSCAWCIRATFRVDLYDPSRDEIRVGLFSRCVSPFVLLAGDDNLWARDPAGIMRRYLADSAITFC